MSRAFPEATHRVALAAFEAMRGELASAEFAGDSEFAPIPRPANPDGTRSKVDDVPPDGGGFWLEWKNEGRALRERVTLRACRYQGRTREGRSVEVAVLAEAGGSLVSVHVGEMGDRALSGVLLDKVADRLRHPVNPPGSDEEAASFQAFFGGIESREALLSARKRASPTVPKVSPVDPRPKPPGNL